MTVEELYAKVRDWDLKALAPDKAAYYLTVLDQLEYLAKREWRTYLPAERPDLNPNYMDRLALWIGNLSDETDQQLLLEYARYICFFSHDDFAALYRTAFEREVSRWVADTVRVRLQPRGVQGFQSTIRAELYSHTWYCPITDSMDINEFYKVNHLTGIGHRPTFATLQMLAERAPLADATLGPNLKSYMANPGLDPNQSRPELKRLVLLEDVVGSGSQSLSAVRWAVTSLQKPVLFIPLILCPNGAQAIREEVQKLSPLLTVAPVIELQRGDLLGPERAGAPGWPISPALELLAVRCAPRASPGIDTFGFGQTGCSITTFANTPDNTLPLIHNSTPSGNWSPLFPRVYRD